MSWASTKNTGTKTGTTDGSQSDTASAFADIVTMAQDGWTIYLPTGSYTWGSACNFSTSMVYSVTLAGAGGNGNRTTITGSFSGSQLIGLVATSGKLTKCQFIDWNGGGNGYSSGMMAIDQTGIATAINSFWIENCSFSNYTSLGLQVLGPNRANAGALFGLIDLCTFTAANNVSGIYVNVGNSDNQWFDTMTLGTVSTVCVEDCTFNHTNTTVEGNPAIDARYNGAKYLFRYNTLTNWVCVAHGSDSAPTSTLQVEYYNNTTTVDTQVDYGINLRGGVQICYGNSFNIAGSGGYNSGFKLVNDSCNSGGGFPGTYPRFQQIGQGSNPGGATINCGTSGSGTTQTIGSYFWSNTYNNVTTQISTNGAQQADIVLNRDYFTSAPSGGTPLTSYTALQYPHPLRGASGGGGASRGGLCTAGGLVRL